MNEDRYSQFERKYVGLYFPKYQEDAGYYIPMSNLDKAFFANRNCEVSIAGKVVNFRDINEYEDLMRLGRAFYSNDGISMLATLTPIHYSGGNLDPVGEEYDSGWTTYKTDKYYKIKLKARRRWKGISQGPASGFESIFHLEFCFRKESWLGWSNFKSNTTMVFKADIPGFGTYSPSLDEKNGHSSHDWEFLYPIKLTQDQQYRYATYYETPCHATVRFKNIGYDVQYNWTMRGAQATFGLYGNPTLMTPYY